MRIAIIGDTHLGYSRFEEDSFIQAEKAFVDASDKTDIIIFAGDLFDMKIPKLETLDRTLKIFQKIEKPIYAIHGNHERRTRDMVNPAQLIATSGAITYLHGEAVVFEKNGEKIQILGLGNVPEEYSTIALKKTMEQFEQQESAHKILVIHQSIREFMPHAEDELSLDYLETLPFDLIIDGHIHKTMTKLSGRLLIPGSTVLTQLKKEEIEPKGYFIYDTKTRKSEFVEIQCRKFFYEEIEFLDATETELRETIKQRIQEIKKEYSNAVVALKINGTLKEGLTNSDIQLDGYGNVFIDNRLNINNLSARLEKIRELRKENISVKELAVKELQEKTQGKVTLFNVGELFEKLAQGVEESIEYLEESKKKS